MKRHVFFAVLSLSTIVLAHGGGHLKGVVSTISDAQLTVTTEEKDTVAVALTKETRFENDGKLATAKELTAGQRVVVHLKSHATPAVAVLVKFSLAPATRIDVSVTGDGFVVTKAPTLKVGQPVTLVVTRTVEKTCATDIVMKDFGVNAPLPLNKPVEVTFTPTKSGDVTFTCAMGMISGSLKVE